ncbi:MAG: hypothetical protein ACLSAH_11450 [Bilophila wadsworthia]
MKAIGGNVDWWEYLNHACFINTIYVALSFLTIISCAKVRLPGRSSSSSSKSASPKWAP